MSVHIKHNKLRHSLSGCKHDEVPKSSEPVDPQQWTWGEFGQSLGEEEEGHGTPVLRAQPLNHLQQHTAYKAKHNSQRWTAM